MTQSLACVISLGLTLALWCAPAQAVQCRFPPQDDSEEAFLSDYLPGTCYFTGYMLASGRSRPWEPGDVLSLRCDLVSSEEDSLPCSSSTMQVTLGNRELPIGIEWPLLGLRWGAFLAYPVANRDAVLDPRFTRCGRDSVGLYHTRITVTSADTSARTNEGPRLRRLRQAVDSFRVNATAADTALVRAQLAFDDDPHDPLRAVIYAGALSDAGHCEEYGRLVVQVASLGLGCRGMTAESEAHHCEGWHRKGSRR